MYRASQSFAVDGRRVSASFVHGLSGAIRIRIIIRTAILGCEQNKKSIRTIDCLMHQPSLLGQDRPARVSGLDGQRPGEELAVPIPVALKRCRRHGHQGRVRDWGPRRVHGREAVDIRRDLAEGWELRITVLVLLGMQLHGWIR